LAHAEARRARTPPPNPLSLNLLPPNPLSQGAGARGAGLLLLLAALLLAIPAQARDTVRIGWLKSTNDLALAKAHGSLDRALGQHGASVEWDGPFAASSPAVEAMNAGAIDITAGSSGSLAASLAAHAPVVAFTWQHLGPRAEAIVVPADSAIHDVHDLAGHGVAVNRGGTGEYLLVRALQTAAMPLDSVRRQYFSPADAGPAFASGHLDAWAVWDPFLSVAEQDYGARVIADGQQIGSDNAIVMLASRDFTARHRDLLQIVYDVLMAENAWSLKNQAEAGRIWASVLDLPEALGPRLGQNNAVPDGPVNPPEIRKVADWYVANGIVPAVPGLDAAMLDLSK
jgi:sulfonate transport system substrate-binding protein